VQIDLSCVTRDYLRRIIAWLPDDLPLMYEVTKPGDYAFSALRRFHCPRHPWEVCLFYAVRLSSAYMSGCC
jgi:hypothetical protein